MSNDRSHPADADHGAGDRGPSGPSSDDGLGPELDRLPPPAFPPGSRRSSVPRPRSTPDAESPAAGGDESDLPDEALISPDDPIRKEGRGIPDDAFISPDDPLVPANRDEEEGTVTGMGEFLESPGGKALQDEKPSIHELPYLLNHLAERINESGESALEVHAEMGRFQAALRSFLKGFLEGSSS